VWNRAAGTAGECRAGVPSDSSNTLRPLREQNDAIGLLLTAGVPSSDDRACAGSSPSCLVLRQWHR
jgi:hypothetical protein